MEHSSSSTTITTGTTGTTTITTIPSTTITTSSVNKGNIDISSNSNDCTNDVPTDNIENFSDTNHRIIQDPNVDRITTASATAPPTTTAVSSSNSSHNNDDNNVDSLPISDNNMSNHSDNDNDWWVEEDNVDDMTINDDSDDDDISSLFSDDDVLDDIDFSTMIDDSVHTNHTATTTTTKTTSIRPTTAANVSRQTARNVTQQQLQQNEMNQRKRMYEIRRIYLQQQRQQTQVKGAESVVPEIKNQQYRRHVLTFRSVLFEQIQQRELFVQQQQQQQSHRHDNNTEQSSKDNHYPNATAQSHGRTSTLQTIHSYYNSWFHFLIFEFYLTIPAGINLFFHSVIMICIYDLIVDISTRIVYNSITSITTTMFNIAHDAIIYTINVLFLSSSPVFWFLPRSITSFVHKTTQQLTLLSSKGWDQQYYFIHDVLFYILLCWIGFVCIHYSGYLYWWLSNPTYTLLKYDSHNRIRLQQQQQQQQQQQFGRVDTTPEQHFNPRNTTNTYMYRLYCVRKFPLLRMLLYMIGYFIFYSISHTLLSMTFPYFSQHTSILPYRPSTTFDKTIYTPFEQHNPTIVDNRIDQQQRHVFPCLIQTCQSEILRQQYSHAELLRQEQLYTKQRLAKSSYVGYWLTWVYSYGDKSICPIFDTIPNHINHTNQGTTIMDDENDDDEDEEDEEVDDSEKLTSLVDMDNNPVFNNTGEILFALFFGSIGIALLYWNGFIFWYKY